MLRILNEITENIDTLKHIHKKLCWKKNKNFKIVIKYNIFKGKTAFIELSVKIDLQYF